MDVRLGLVQITSKYGAYLQSKDNGEMHASNYDAASEETWELYQIDAVQQLYAFKSVGNAKWLCKDGPYPAQETIVANRDLRQQWEAWKIIPGTRCGQAPERICIQGFTNQYMMSNTPGINAENQKGEVYASKEDLSCDPGWRGWWIPKTVQKVPDGPHAIGYDPGYKPFDIDAWVKTLT